MSTISSATAKALPKLPSKADRVARAEAEPGKIPAAADIPIVNAGGESMGFAVAREEVKVDLTA